MNNADLWCRAVHRHGRGWDNGLKETSLFRMTLREQADAVVHITLKASPDTIGGKNHGV